jgi:hypothetical protein
MAQEIDINLNVNTEQASNSLGSLRSQLRQAQADVAELSERFGVTSEQAIEAARRAAELRDRIGDARDLTDSFNPDSKFKALASAANIAVGALAGYQGALGMIGVESENVENSILKIQSALALAEGLEVLQEIPDAYENIKAVAVDAFRAIKGAIGATGIGLLVVALGALYANWDALKKLVGDSIPALKEGSKQFDKLKEVFFGVGNAIVQYLLTPFKSVLKLLQLDFKGAIQEIKNGADVIGNYEKGAAKERQEQNDAYAKARLEKQIKNKENEIAVQKALGKDTYNLEKDNLHRKLILNKDNQEELEKLRQEERLLDAAHKKSLQDKQAAHNAELKKKQEEAEAEAKRKREEALKEEQELAKIKRDKQREDTFKVLDEIEKATKENTDRLLTENQIALNNENERYAKLKKAAEDAGMLPEQIEELDKQHKNNLANINNEYYAKEAEKAIERDAKKKEQEDKKAAEDIEREQKRTEAIQSFKENLNNIISGIEASGLAKSKAGQAISKALALTQIGIDTAVAIGNASKLATAEGAKAALVGGPGAGTVARIVSYASSYAQVLTNFMRAKTMLSSGGSGGGGAAGGGNTGGMSGGSAPSFNVVGQSGANQIAESIGARESQPMRAFVVGGDVTTQQGLNRGIVQNATLG